MLNFNFTRVKLALEELGIKCSASFFIILFCFSHHFLQNLLSFSSSICCHFLRQSVFIFFVNQKFNKFL